MFRELVGLRWLMQEDGHTDGQEYKCVGSAASHVIHSSGGRSSVLTRFNRKASELKKVLDSVVGKQAGL